MNTPRGTISPADPFQTEDRRMFFRHNSDGVLKELDQKHDNLKMLRDLNETSDDAKGEFKDGPLLQGM
jgi:hypothetical protein